MKLWTNNLNQNSNYKYFNYQQLNDRSDPQIIKDFILNMQINLAVNPGNNPSIIQPFIFLKPEHYYIRYIKNGKFGGLK